MKYLNTIVFGCLIIAFVYLANQSPAATKQKIERDRFTEEYRQTLSGELIIVFRDNKHQTSYLYINGGLTRMQ